MNRKIPIVINGIHTFPKDEKAWTDLIAIWLMENCPAVLRVIRIEYFTPFLMAIRSLINKRQTRKLINKILAFEGRDDIVFVLIGHSNGCDIICYTLGKLLELIRGEGVKLPKIEIILIAGAVEHDFEKNNINDAIRSGLVTKVTVFASKNDKILSRFARVSRFIFRGFGYGYLGFMAARNILRLNIMPNSPVKIIIDNSQDHTSWLKDNLNTFHRICAEISYE